MPEGVMVSDGDDEDDRKTGDEDDSHRALRDINLEDIDENRSNFTDVMTNHNGNSNNSHDEKVIKKKKKKEKSGEKSKKKKHKKKEGEKNARSTKSNEENTPSNDIDLWLE